MEIGLSMGHDMAMSQKIFQLSVVGRFHHGLFHLIPTCHTYRLCALIIIMKLRSGRKASSAPPSTRGAIALARAVAGSALQLSPSRARKLPSTRALEQQSKQPLPAQQQQKAQTKQTKQAEKLNQATPTGRQKQQPEQHDQQEQKTPKAARLQGNGILLPKFRDAGASGASASAAVDHDPLAPSPADEFSLPTLVKLPPPTLPRPEGTVHAQQVPHPTPQLPPYIELDSMLVRDAPVSADKAQQVISLLLAREMPASRSVIETSSAEAEAGELMGDPGLTGICRSDINQAPAFCL
jgi:hypothetical protein